MGIIRNQSIKTSAITYIGFAIGGLSTLIIAKMVDPNIAGLTRFFISVASIIFSFANFGSVTTMNKFYPYYRDMLVPKNRDILGIVLMLCIAGFLLNSVAAWLLQDLVARKYGTKSYYVVEFYYLLLPFSFFYLFFTVFENYAYNQFKTIYPIFLKEVGMRALSLILVGLLIYGLISVRVYIYSYTFLYGVLLAALLIYLYRQQHLVFSFSISKVTKRLAGKMITFNTMIYGGAILSVIATNIDTLSISSIEGLDYGFVFDFGMYICTLIIIPQRSITAIALPILAKAWKDKDTLTVQSLYIRSSNTMLTYGLLIYLLICLNVREGMQVIGLKEIYYLSIPCIFYLGLMRVLEMSFGVNSQIIVTSNFWRVEFFSNLIQFIIIIPLNITFLKLFGIEGNAIANLLSTAVFALIRFGFIWYKFGLQPFNRNTLYILLTGVAGFLICYYIRIDNAYISIIVRTAVLSGLYLGILLYFDLSKDLKEGYHMVMQRIGKWTRS